MNHRNDFPEVVYNLSKQVEGEEGEFILSNAEKELLLEKKAVVIANPLGVTCDERRIVSQIYKNLSEKISSDYSGRVCRSESADLTICGRKL
ncbi:MAG: type II-A CRISPR-associated protein Csn2 [Lachnospiraceae bacterium]